MAPIDLRSDTVTLPTPEMREAMAHAEVGDDVYREDPNVNRLEELAAERMGKQAGLFVPSGTMGNLIAFMVLARRGDEAILGELSHPFTSEVGSLSALGGIQPHTLRNQPDGTMSLDDIRRAIRDEDVHHPTTRVISLENTHNRCNGVPLTVEYTASVAELARANDIALHIDGARIFNAAVALGVPAADLVAPADSVTFCLSKGLAAPVGSMLCGSSDFIHEARRTRKQLGGGMRQAGVLAAAGIIAVEKMVGRLAEDHARARRLADELAEYKDLSVPAPHTNIVRFTLSPSSKVDAKQLFANLAQQGVLIDYGRYEGFRACTHYGIEDSDIVKTLAAFGKVLRD